MKKFRELKEEVSTPPIGVRSLYTKMYAKHGGAASKVKDAQSKAYSEVEKKHGKEMRDSLEAFHKKNMNEAVKDKFDIGEYDQEGDMAKSDLRSILANAKRVHDMLEDDDNLPEWVQAKITKAEDYMSTVANYMEAEMNEEVEELEETPKVDQGLSGKQKVAARASRADNSPILNVGNTTGGQWRGKTSPSPYKDSNVAKSGERKGMITKSALQRTKDAIRSRLNKEEVVTEMDKSQPSSSRGAEGLPLGKKAEPVKTDKVQSDALKILQKQYKKVKEEVELDEENKPTNPELWARAKSMAKSKFDVYPSAYANGWAAKWYKSKGGGWRSVNEENYEVTVMHTTKDGEKGEHTHKVMNADDSRHAKNIALQKHEKMLKTKGVEVRGMGTTASKVMEQKDDTPFKADKPEKQIATPGKYGAGYSAARHLARMAMQKQIEKMKKPVKEEKDDLPFKADKPKKQSVIPGKYGAGYSTARDLARQAMQKQIEKMKKKPVKESLEESRKTEIVKEIIKKKKESKGNDEKFNDDPMISNTITRNY